MDRVTEIQRRGGVASLRFLSGEVVRVPSAVYLERRLRIGDFADPEAYRLFAAQRGYPHALEAAMKFLALRERSEKEVRTRLRRSCFDEGTVQRVVDTLTVHELLSDRRFADQWAQSRSRKYGKTRIARELKLKGVESGDIKKALDALPEEEEYQRAVAQGKKLAKKLQGDPQKIARALVRRGYGFSLARRAAEEAAGDQDAFP